PPHSGYSPADPSITQARKTIAQLRVTKWESGFNAKAIRIDTSKGWYYLGCNNCTTKLVGDTGDLWCPSCKIEDPTTSPFKITQVTQIIRPDEGSVSMDGPVSKKLRIEENLEESHTSASTEE
ncbi:hypothetical protein MKW94_001776, partial [Papaver nudicaule]|nr:hypothetical protein [Papaver nudicaule]